MIIAADRATRPYTTPPIAPGTDSGAAECPFCPGHEDRTPPESYRTGAGQPDTPGWRVRVVPNLFPIVGDGTTGNATGTHEVVILSPDHDRDFGALTHDAAHEVFVVLRDRARVHLEGGSAYACAFLNHGRGAGASIAHPHAQLVAADAASEPIAAMTARFETDLVAREMADARRSEFTIIDGPAMAWCPPASWSPYLIRIAHRSTRARFDEATDAEVGVVADATRVSVGFVHRLLGPVPYNIVIHSAPPGIRCAEMHWHVELIPRTSVVAGYEIGSGLYANSVAPEQAAALLRDAS